MPASGIKLLDVNVWLALAYSNHQHHAKAKAWFETQAEDTCAFCRITQMALLRLLTNTKIMGPSIQNQLNAWKIYDQMQNDDRVSYLPEPPNLEQIFRTFTQKSSPSQSLWTDAYLAAFAVATGSQFITLDLGFDRFNGLDLFQLPT